MGRTFSLVFVLATSAISSLGAACSGEETSAPPATGGTTAPPATTPTPRDPNKGVPQGTEVDPDETAGETVPTCTGEAGSFYALKIKKLASTVEFPLCAYEDTVVLVVNGASQCGFTGQYEPLQAMYAKYAETEKKKFVILAFPSDSFNQELATDKDVSEACTEKYSITFPLATIGPVIDKPAAGGKPAETAQPVYQWIYSQPGITTQVDWNFEKYLIGKDGKIVRRFSRTESVEAGGVLDLAIQAELAK